MEARLKGHNLRLAHTKTLIFYVKPLENKLIP